MENKEKIEDGGEEEAESNDEEKEELKCRFEPDSEDMLLCDACKWRPQVSDSEFPCSKCTENVNAEESKE